MLLNRTAHRIGYVGSMKSWNDKKIESLSRFLDFIILHINYNIHKGIHITCIDTLNVDFKEIDFSRMEEDSLEQEKIDIISNFLSFKESRIFFFSSLRFLSLGISINFVFLYNWLIIFFLSSK